MTLGGRPQGRPPASFAVEAGIKIVDVLLVQSFLGQPQALAETYKMEIINLQMRHSILMESLVA